MSDFTTAYFFRGILQERNGFIWQPSAEVGINLWEGDEDSVFTSVDFGVGVWNSFHSNKTLGDGSGPSNLYETDIYPSLSVSFPNDLELSMIYYVYTSPNGAFDTVQNFDFGLAYDDSSLWGDSDFSAGPSVTVSFELDNTNFGDRRGSWLGLNAAPSVVAFEEAEYPLTLALPLALGLSISEYYEVEGEGDETFGFFSFGFSGSLPLAFIPQDYGAWSVNAGVNVLVLGENLEEANLGDQPSTRSAPAASAWSTDFMRGGAAPSPRPRRSRGRFHSPARCARPSRLRLRWRGRCRAGAAEIGLASLPLRVAQGGHGGDVLLRRSGGLHRAHRGAR